ncbi:putative kinesin-like protein KIF11-like [Capsicum annuum]|nr:putative kinesin-like protein KIF11-like [Capsicum annuum]
MSDRRCFYRHMTENEGVFPRETYARKEVGPWDYLLSGFQRTKKKIFEKFMEQKSSSTHALTSTSELKDSDNVVSADSHDSGSMNDLKITIHSEKTSLTNMAENVDSETYLSSHADNSKALEVINNMKNISDSVGPEELLNISSKECEGSTDYGVNGMSSGASSICGKANSNDGVQLINGFHHSEFVEKEREQLLAEEASSSVQISSEEEILSKSEEACFVEHQMQVEISRTSHRVSANKSGSTAPENEQQEIMESCKFSSNLELGRSGTDDSSCVIKRVAQVVDVAQEKRNNEPELEAKNGQMQKKDVISDGEPEFEVKNGQMQKKDVISDILSIFEKNDGISNLKQVAHSNSFIQSESTNKWRDVLVKKTVLSTSEHHPAEDISIPIALSNTKMDEISSFSNDSSHVEADHQAIDQIVDPKSEKSVPRESEHLDETSQNVLGKSGTTIKGLIELIGELPPWDPSFVRHEEIVVDRSDRERSASNRIQAHTDKQTLDSKKRKTSSQSVTGKKKNSGLSNEVHADLNPGDERTEIRNTAPLGFCMSIETKETTSLREKGNLSKGEEASSSEKLSDENKMIVKFVNIKATESAVSRAFQGSGAISKVVFPSVKSTNYKAAHIYFKSQEGRQKALKRSDVMIMDTVVLEATCIPDLIGYPEVPTSLVKHPSRTVMIKEFKHNVTFRDIEEALAFCISNITGIFFGSSSSVAYVEFEAFASLMLFSDLILYVPSLNGYEEDGQQLVAKPAPVYSSHVLSVLWSQPEGRKHLKTAFNSMLQKVGGDTDVLAELVDNFYAGARNIINI